MVLPTYMQSIYTCTMACPPMPHVGQSLGCLWPNNTHLMHKFFSLLMS